MVYIVTGTIGLVLALTIISLIRRDRLHVRHGLGWIVVALTCALLGFSPGIIDRLASVLGVGYPPVLALTLGIGALIIKILLMDIERSKLETRNQRLIQRTAILESDLNSLQRKLSSLSNQKENT